MGVAGAGPFVRQLRPPKSSDAPKIQESFESTRQAFQHIHVAHKDAQHYTLYIDFWGTLWGHYHTLCGKYFRPSFSSSLAKHFYPHKSVSSEDLPSFLVSELFKVLEEHVTLLRSVFSKEKTEIVIVLDHPTATVRGKYLTKLDRACASSQAALRFERARSQIEELLKLRHHTIHGKPAADQRHRASRFNNHGRFKRRFGKRTVESALWANVKEIRKTAWTQIHMRLSTELLVNSLDQSKFSVFEERDCAFAFTQEEDAQIKRGTTITTVEGDENTPARCLPDSELAIPQLEHIDEARKAWQTNNEKMLSDRSPIKVVISSNEADITLLNFLSASNGNTISILLGNDSDYHFFPENGDLQYTVSRSYLRDKDSRFTSKKPWIVTDVAKLQTRLGGKWKGRKERIMAALLAGHDYTGSGLKAAGLNTLYQYDVVKPTFEKTINRVINLHLKKKKEQKASYWQRAFEHLTNVDALVTCPHTHIVNRLLHGLRILLLRQHRKLEQDTKEQFDEAFNAVRKPKGDIKSKYVNPFSLLAEERRNIELLFDPRQSRSERHTACKPVRQDIKRQRDLSCNLARSPDTSLPQKRHAAWVYDVGTPEMLRPSKNEQSSTVMAQSARPDPNEELSSITENASDDTIIFFGPDDSHDLKLVEGDGDEEAEEEEDDDDEEEDEDDDDDDDSTDTEEDGEMIIANKGSKRTGNATSSRAKKKAKGTEQDAKGAETEKAQPEKAKKDVALQLSSVYPTKTHSAWLPSALQNMSTKDKRQKDKPLLPLMQVLGLAEQLSIQETLLPIYQEYFRRLYNDPRFRYIHDFRTFHASKKENEVELCRNVVRLFSAERASRERGRPVPFSFLTHKHNYDPSAAQSTLIPAIKRVWLENYVPKKKERKGKGKAKADEDEEEGEEKPSTARDKGIIQEALSDPHVEAVTEAAAFAKLRETASKAMDEKLQSYHLNVLAFFYDNLAYKYDCVLMDIVNEYFIPNSPFAAKVPVPIAPFISKSVSIEYHGPKFYRAIKSKLRTRPLQHALSSYIMDRCQSALPAATPAVLKKAHAGIWTCFVETSVLAFETGNYSEDAAVAFHNCTKVMAEDTTMGILNHLYGTLKPLIQPEARTRSLRSFFEGQDKIHFGLKHLRLFMAKLGYDFAISYAPSYCTWTSGRLAPLFNAGEQQASSIADWLNTYFLKDGTPTAEAHGCRVKVGRKMGALDEMWCFDHVRKGRYRTCLMANNSRTELKLSEDWKDCFKEYIDQAKAKFQTMTGTPWNAIACSAKNRSVLFDILFKRCIPKHHIWAGFCQSDGYNLRMASHDPSTCVVPPTLATHLKDVHITKEVGTPLSFLKLLIERGKQSFCSPGTWRKEPFDEENPPFDETSSFRGSVFYARKYLKDKKLSGVTTLPTEATRKGMYKHVIRLDGKSAPVVRDWLMLTSEQNEGAEIKIAGDDPGIRFSQAIHINSPPSSAGYLAHLKGNGKPSQEQEKSHPSQGVSDTFLVAPHTLAEVARSVSRIKHRLRSRMAFSTFDILNAGKQQLNSGDKHRLSSFYNLVDLSLKCSRDYCHSSFRAQQQVRRFYDKTARQFAELVWPEHHKYGPKSPLLFVVGDSCGYGNSRARKHHADYSTSGVRQLQKRLESWKLPVKFVLTDESCSSQLCPDPKCRDDQGLRNMLAKLPYKDSTAQCLRVHQCTRCYRTYHRDTAAAMNIGFTAWHILVHGRHPWRERNE